MKRFDYVIVGGGSAGCVLANRLSEDGATRVLLLEAGGRDYNPLISIPIGMGKLHAWRMHDWGYETEAELALEGRRLEAKRGKVLGGSSSVNVMAFTRGAPADYDRWERLGASGWAYADVLPYFRRMECWEGGADRWRGGDGPLGVQFAKTTDPIFSAWTEAGRGAGLPVTADYNGAESEGFGRSQYSIRDGRRSSSSRAYLRPAWSRRNLTVVTRAHTTRIRFAGRRATGVDVKVRGSAVTFGAEREVILCAGAFDSPKLLMLSGVGPAEHLNSVGVETLVDLPGVGRNLQDHLGLWLTWSRRSPGPFHAAMRFDRMAVSMVRAYLFGAGPGTVVPGGLHAFLRTHPASTAPDLEFMFHTAPPHTRLWFPGVRPPYVDAYAIRPTLLHPRSRGEVMLRSADPAAPPRIRYGFLSDPKDLATLREGVRLARRLGESPEMDAYRGEDGPAGSAASSDAEIDAAIRQGAATAHHPAGTCRIGVDDEAVVDPNLRVRGVEGLRVVDASVMPDMPSAHINAATLMVAEKASDHLRGRITQTRPPSAETERRAHEFVR